MKGEFFHIRIHKNKDCFVDDNQFIKIMKDVIQTEFNNEQEILDLFNSVL